MTHELAAGNRGWQAWECTLDGIFGQLVPAPFGAAERGGQVVAGQHHRELLAAVARDEIAALDEEVRAIHAGRVPTDKGYRFFVDTLLRQQTQRRQTLRWLSGAALLTTSPLALMACGGGALEDSETTAVSARQTPDQTTKANKKVLNMSSTFIE